jgi:DNA-binding GntR family transcriptional regulator
MRKSAKKLPRLAPVERETMQEQVYQKLRDALMQGRFSPGDTMTLRALAEAFGTSPMPIREALRKLVAEQALMLLPNRTVIVPVITTERVDEFRRIRIALEGMVTEEAARRITPAEVERLRNLSEEITAAGIVGDVKRYLSKNQEFHMTIYRAAALPTARRMIENLWLQIGPALNFLLTRDTRNAGPGINPAEKSNAHHRDAVTALERRDPAAARQAIVMDISDAADYIRNSQHLGVATEPDRRAASR